MILDNGHATEYLNLYREGKIKLGLGIGCELDEYLRFKEKQLNIILGHDNVGKTYWFLWYMLCLSSLHDLKWVLWCGENSSGQLMRDLIQMYTGKRFVDLDFKEIRKAEIKMEYWFKFVSNENMYKPSEMLDIFSSTDAKGHFIDPFTGLDRGMTHADNYEFLNQARQFVNQTGKTIYISTHPNSESGRTSMLYPKGHNWEGHLMPPLKAHIEGGKPFLNRCDDMITIHRLVKHQSMWNFTMVEVEKVKDKETGGSITKLNTPILFDYNFGLGFKNNYQECIKRASVKEYKQTEIDSMNAFRLMQKKVEPKDIEDFNNFDEDVPF